MLRLAAIGLLLVVACAPATPAANGAGAAGGVDDICPIEPERFAIFDEGDVPLVITSTHAGASSPLGCDPGDDVLRAVEPRVCDGDLDACASGPCRAGGGDGNARLLTFALVEELERCLGGRPHLALAETVRLLVDMNRDAHDPVGGSRCAMEDEAALPYWQSFHRGVEGLVAHAASLAAKDGRHPLLIDLHTYNSLAAAPPPAVMIGSGVPFGTTLPRLAAEDPALARVFGNGGLRERLLVNLAGLAEGTLMVHPSSRDAPLDGLFSGRYVVHRYARVIDDETGAAGPSVDALQIEVSSGLRDDALAAAQAIAEAICGSLGDRLSAPSRDRQGVAP